MKFAKAVVHEGVSQIAYHQKEVWNIYELFHTRYNLHKRAYQHRVGNAIEKMIADALHIADPHFLIPTDGGKRLRLSECVSDMAGYEQLTDGILRQIRMTTTVEMAPARAILERIYKRDLYPFIQEVLLDPGIAIGAEWCQPDRICHDIVALGEGLRAGDIFVEMVKINYGMKDRNPVDCVNFFNAKDTKTPVGPIRGETVSCLIPHVFQERYIRCYCRQKEKKADAAEAFNKWLQQCPMKRVAPASPAPTDSPGSRKRARS